MPRRPIAHILLLWYLAACTTWHVEKGVSPEGLIVTDHPSKVRLTRSDSSLIILQNPRIAGGDTIVGESHKVPTRVPVSDVRQVAIQHVSAIGIVLALTASAAGVALVFSMHHCCSP